MGRMGRQENGGDVKETKSLLGVPGVRWKELAKVSSHGS